MSGLKKKIFRAGIWTMAGYGASQLVRFGTNLVMTRLLAPESFGVMAIALTFMFGLALFSDLGLRQNVVQSRRGDDPVFLGTAWAVQVLRGVVLLAFALIIAGIMLLAQQGGFDIGTSVYADPLLPQVVSVLAVTALISGLESINLATASRRLELGRVTLIDLIGQAVAIPVMLAWASVDRSIWALVAGAIVAGVVRTVLSHIYVRGPSASWAWEKSALGEIFGFGKWVFLSSVLGFFVLSADRLLLGGFVGADVLGMYAIAYLIVSAIQLGLAKLSVSVALPALSEVFRRGSLSEFRAIYYKGRLPFDLASLLMAGFLWQAGDTIVAVLYDARYRPAGHMLSLLALTLIVIRYDVAEKCFMAIGKPKFLMVINLIRLILLCVLIPSGFSWFQFEGALWAMVLASFLGAVAVIVLKAKERILDIGRELMVLPLFFVGALIGKLGVLWAT